MYTVIYTIILNKNTLETYTNLEYMGTVDIFKMNAHLKISYFSEL